VPLIPRFRSVGTGIRSASNIFVYSDTKGRLIGPLIEKFTADTFYQLVSEADFMYQLVGRAPMINELGISKTNFVYLLVIVYVSLNRLYIC
jgi:hypothetical protein